MSSRKRGKAKDSQGAPTRWSEWEWNDTYQRYHRYRLDTNGDYEFEWDNANETKGGEYATNDPSQPYTLYPSSTAAVPQTSVEDLNTQYQGLDLGEGCDRGRKKSREDIRDEPRDPSVDPGKPVKGGPQPKPKPNPKPSQESYSQNSISAYDSSSGGYEASPASPTFSPTAPYPSISTVHYAPTSGEIYDHKTHDPSNSQDYYPKEIRVKIKKRSLMATISSSRDSFISSKMVDELDLKTSKITPWMCMPPNSKESYKVQAVVTTNIEPSGRAKSKDVELYVLSRKCPLEHPVILGTDILGTVESAASDYFSSDSGYGTASSRRPSFNQPPTAYRSTTYTTGQPSYSSPSAAYHQPIYAQNLPSVQETPSSSYSTSPYQMQGGSTMPHDYSAPYNPIHDASHGSSHESYTAQRSAHDPEKNSQFSSYDSGAHSGTTGENGSGDGGMGYDDDNYSLHSQSTHATHSAFTPRPVVMNDQPQNVYSPTSDGIAYSNEYITR